MNVDDTSQYFADYEDILNIPVVEDQQIIYHAYVYLLLIIVFLVM